MSASRALDYCSLPSVVSADPALLRSCDLYYPGGAAGEAMEHLINSGLDTFLREARDSGMPILGICLGTQVIFDYSEENDTTCLGLVPGIVKRFPMDMIDDLQGRSRFPTWGGIT